MQCKPSSQGESSTRFYTRVGRREKQLLCKFEMALGMEDKNDESFFPVK